MNDLQIDEMFESMKASLMEQLKLLALMKY